MTDKYKRRPSGAAVVLECRVHLALQSVGPFITKFTLVKLLLLLLCSHNLPFTLLLEQQLGGASDVHTNVQALSYHGRWFNNVIKHVWVCVLHLYIATHPLLKGVGCLYYVEYTDRPIYLFPLKKMLLFQNNSPGLTHLTAHSIVKFGDGDGT